MEDIKSKDYFIIRIKNIYTHSDMKVKEWTQEVEDEWWKRNYEMTQTYMNFKKEFIEKFSGKKITEWCLEFMYDTYDCAIEHMERDLGMFLKKEEDYEVYLVPWSNTEMIEWLKEKSPKPNKIVKVLKHITFLTWRRRNPMSKSNYSREHTIETHKKHPELLESMKQSNEEHD